MQSGSSDQIPLTAPVVMLECSDISSRGSGFLVSSSGHIVTNAHVVSRIHIGQGGALTVTYSRQITVHLAGLSVTARLVTDVNDPIPIVFDYAILKVDVDGDLPYMEVGEAADVQQGDEVWCVGFPLDFDTPLLTRGVVSAIVKRPSHINSLHTIRTIVSDAVIQKGSSGGPMVPVLGRSAVAINTLRHPLGHPVERLKRLLNDPSVATMPGLRELIEFNLQHAWVGLHHAVDLRHAVQDTNFPV